MAEPGSPVTFSEALSNRPRMRQGSATPDFSQFVPPHLRQPLNEIGALGYQLVDNVVGIDDGYDSMGELLAQSLREDPVGTAKGIATGVIDSAKAAYEDPMGTLSALGDEFVTAYEMLSTPMAMDASREDVGQRLEAATLLSAVVPGLQVAGAGTKVLGRAAAGVVDEAQFRQAKRFMAENEPQFPGLPFENQRFYSPSTGERLEAFSGRGTPAQQQAVIKLAAAAGLENSQQDAGIVQLAGQRLTGEPLSSRFAAVTPEEMFELRPSRGSDESRGYGIPRAEDPSLDSGEALYYGGDFPMIVHSPRSTPEERASADIHEMTHADLHRGQVPDEAVGTSVEVARAARLDAMDRIRDAISRTERGSPERLDLQRRLSEIQATTPAEIYHRNPGEMLARLSEGDATTAKSLSLTQALNPYLVGGDIRRRANIAKDQLLFSERIPSLASVLDSVFPETRRDRRTRDVHSVVPMDLGQALLPSSDFRYTVDPTASEALLKGRQR